MTTDTARPPLADGDGPTALTGFAPANSGGSSTIAPASAVASILPVGAFRTDDHRYYFNGRGPVPGVTSVLEILSKPALVTWRAQETARAILMDPDRYIVASDDPTFASGLRERINAALKVADEQRDTAGKLGTSIHLLADMVSREEKAPGGAETAYKGFQVSEQEKPYLEAWRHFLGRYSASAIVSSEHMVWSENGYGGTYDLIMQMPDGLWLIDIKTSKGIYPEYGLQLAAYRWADSIILPGNPLPYAMPLIQRTGVLHLRPDQYPDTGWRLIEYPTDYEKDYVRFLGALELYQWRAEGRFTKSNLQYSEA